VANIIEQLIGGGLKGILDGGASIIEKFVPDPNMKQEALLELKKLDIQAQQAVMDAEKSRLADVDSARKMYATDNRIQKILALLFTVSFFAFMVFILFLMKSVELAPDQTNLIFAMFGAVSGIMVTIIGFYFGSSKSSHDKDETMNAVVKASQKP